MGDGKSDWNDSKLVARAMLHNRTARRTIIGRMVMAALFLMVAGVWLVDGWLAKNPWCFLLWWGGCALLSCAVMLFAVYDALAVFREEREKHR
jgi:hypothetical protein